MSTRSDIFIGLMSGTSLDGADAVACRFAADKVEFLGHAYLPYPAALRKYLLDLLTAGDNELVRCGQAGIHLAHFYARVIDKLLKEQALNRPDICAIGVHGQTIRHCPELGFTVQLNNPALIAELTGIDIIADFRSRDMAAGGEGAVYWFVDGEYIGSDDGAQSVTWPMTPGAHLITAADDRGSAAKAEITVKDPRAAAPELPVLEALN